MTSRPELSAEARYELLREISFGVRDTFDLDTILNHLLDTIRPIVQYDAAGIFVLSEDLLHTPYHAPAMKIAGVVRRGFDPLPPLSDPMQTQGKGVIGHVIATGKPVIVSDVRLNSHYVAGRLATQSEIAVPIKRDHRTIGALNLESDTQGAYHEKDIEILEFLANAASLSIEKAILHAQVVEKKRIEEQLRVAREVQDRLLPQKSPCIEGYDIAALCLPTFEIGGDYFDYIALGEGALGVVIADVAGNGVPAALVMTAFRTLLLTRAPSERNPAELLNELNRRIPEFARRRDFITAFYGILDTKEHRLSFANAGHNFPLHARAGGTIELLQPAGPGLNIAEDAYYTTGFSQIDAGDLIVLYTDGVVEAFNREGEEFGLERLKTVLSVSHHLSAEQLVATVVRNVQAFSGSTMPGDDLTILVVKRKPSGPKYTATTTDQYL